MNIFTLKSYACLLEKLVGLVEDYDIKELKEKLDDIDFDDEFLPPKIKTILREMNGAINQFQLELIKKLNELVGIKED